ncbi:hypothetical protein K491DRAFT_758122 [Lophiostoma macrostomum CBS 122681]|uniref:Uncharacterized protein n=1 Tax=Lophiostoma macrostomum CBS 122681 TaxID=1314788 RepID=A0A6A6T710_9PLEO|nr:hypothetical protein K491DRAFT_758122 [Lophiostoma macrostomum CBS 122681]
MSQPWNNLENARSSRGTCVLQSVSPVVPGQQLNRCALPHAGIAHVLHSEAQAVLQLRVVAGGPQLCYYDKNQLAPDYIIPCYTGSASDQPTYCCKEGSKCMEQSTCYDPPTGVSYQYGCTDPNYNDASCPKKCNLDTSKSNWVGLVLCDKTWFCHHPDHCSAQCPSVPWDPAIKKPPEVNCSTWDKSDKYRALNVGTGNPLRDILVLPGNDADLTSYLSAHPTQKSSQLPTSTSPSTAIGSAGQTSRSESTSASASTPAPPSSSASNAGTATPDPEDGNSTALAAGLGAGIPAALALIGGLIYLLFRRRRRSQANLNNEEKFNDQDGAAHDTFLKSKHHGNDNVAHELDSPTAPTELEGSTVDDRSPIHSTLSSPNRSSFPAQSQFTAPRPFNGPLDAHGNEIHELPG